MPTFELSPGDKRRVREYVERYARPGYTVRVFTDTNQGQDARYVEVQAVPEDGEGRVGPIIMVGGTRGFLQVLDRERLERARKTYDGRLADAQALVRRVLAERERA